MRVAIGCDHAGYKLKQSVIKLLKETGRDYHDFGCYSEESVDYPDIARDVAKAVAAGEYERGILVCATGIGMCIAANKVDGIRAALCHDTFCALRAREHNDANILCLGAVGAKEVPEIVGAFLASGFQGGRHQRRVDKITELES